MIQKFNKPLTISDLESFSKQEPKFYSINMAELSASDKNVLLGNLSFTGFFLDGKNDRVTATVSIENVNAASRSFYLFAGAESNVNPMAPLGLMNDDENTGAFNAIGNLAGLKAISGTPNLKVTDLVKYLSNRCFVLRELEGTFSNPNQYLQGIVKQEYSPLKVVPEEYFLFSDNTLQSVPDQRTFKITKPILMSQLDTLKLTMLGGSEAVPNRATFKFTFGIQYSEKEVFRKLFNLYNASFVAGGFTESPSDNTVTTQVEALSTSPILLPMIHGTVN